MKVEAQQGISAAAKMRLLSKAWRSAFDTYQGRLASMTLEDRGSHHFQKVCSMLPQMRSLQILSAEANTDFAAISSLGQLTSLSLSQTWQKLRFPIQLPCLSWGLLPASLHRLDLCPVIARDVDQLHLPHLTWLSLKVASPRDVDLLPQLPHLKVCVTAYPYLTKRV